MQSRGEQTSDLCRFQIAGYEESFFVALTKDEKGKEHFRMFNSKGEMLNDPSPKIELNDKGEFVFPDNMLDTQLTGYMSGEEKNINDMTFKGFDKEVNSESICQFVVPNPENDDKPGIRYGINKGKDGKIEIKMANSLMTEKQLTSLGKPVSML